MARDVFFTFQISHKNRHELSTHHAFNKHQMIYLVMNEWNCPQRMWFKTVKRIFQIYPKLLAMEKTNHQLKKDETKIFLVHPISVKDISSIKNTNVGWVVWYASNFEDLLQENKKKKTFNFKATFSNFCWNDSYFIID